MNLCVHANPVHGGTPELAQRMDGFGEPVDVGQLGAGEFGDQPRLGGQQRPQRCTVIGRVQCERGASAIPALARGEHHGHAVARPQCDVVVGREHVARHELAVEPLGDCGDNDLLLQQREVSADA